ncbi:isochorismatase [Thermoplasma volcanium GSS1]|uniref:Isochorismatase n=1 Tax=Thermoplasma volcanium (strain ATCC 51530 / DSM 4299 / JCM 9571 / NBRC 15438 / GSS1) TaxID=273116 RepID=Q97BB4_THEVO|nr:isochorismatase family cysteine hydrolase [Thermoplasma volcanium]BAB59685.1 isochorismatase [Thermoplasma volcanium GSS1]
MVARLYRELKEIVEPSHTVLVAWDVQNGLVNSIFNKNEFLGVVKNVIQSARKKGVKVIYTKITPMPPGFESGYRLYSMMKRYGVSDPDKVRFMEPGSPEAEIYSELAPEQGDIVINKNTADLFIGTNVELMLRNAGIDTILFTGIATEFGIESSARSAGNRGFYPVVIQDGVSSPNKDMHEAALKILATQAITIKSEDLMSAWDTAKI